MQAILITPESNLNHSIQPGKPQWLYQEQDLSAKQTKGHEVKWP